MNVGAAPLDRLFGGGRSGTDEVALVVGFEVQLFQLPSTADHHSLSFPPLPARCARSRLHSQDTVLTLAWSPCGLWILIGMCPEGVP